jgi:hypothetical protein
MLGDLSQRRVVVQMMSQIAFLQSSTCHCFDVPSSCSVTEHVYREACGPSLETMSVIVLGVVRLAAIKYTICRCR